MEGVKNCKPAGARECACAYLDSPRPRKQKGGTVIARGVRSFKEHEATLLEPERVRPESCLSCGIGHLHVHDRRERIFGGEVGQDEQRTEVLIFRCDRREECGATWRVLPHFLARHLWRRWELVGRVLTRDPAKRHRVPRRTQQRWRRRLSCAAAVVVALLGQAATVDWVDIAARAGVAATRHSLVETAGGPVRLADLAAVLDDQEPGVRIM